METEQGQSSTSDGAMKESRSRTQCVTVQEPKTENSRGNNCANITKSNIRLNSLISEIVNLDCSSDVNSDNAPPAKNKDENEKTSSPGYNWQGTKTTVAERLAFMFHNQILCDIYFNVGKDKIQKIPAHKFVLSCGSAVFDAMFNGPLSTNEEEIELPDVEPAAFLALLRYLYSDVVQIDAETVMATLYAAKKYAVPALEKHCVQFLKRNLASDNAFTLLSQARLFDEPKLASLCLETIDNETESAFAADGFVEVDLDTLCSVIERDSLKIREAKLFEAVVRWAEAECGRKNLSPTPDNLRKVMGKALKLIRFPLMLMEEFASDAAQSGILTDKEALQLFLYFTVNPKPNIGFIDSPRCSITENELTVARFQYVESRWGYSGTSDRVRLVVDRKIFITGFGLYGATHGPSEYDVLLQLTHLSTGVVCGSNKTTFSCDGSKFTFRVMFKEPVEIQPHTSYIAAVTLKGPDSHYGSYGLKKVSVDVPGEENGKVTFEFFAAGVNNGTTVGCGQIPEIIFRV